jgi:hypothetical protein
VLRVTRRAVVLLACCGALFTVAPTRALASTSGRLRQLNKSDHEVLLSISALASGVDREGRFKRSGTHTWHVRNLGTRTRRWQVRGLRPSTQYLFELRSCQRRRCSRWSSSLHVHTSTRGSAPTSAPNVPSPVAPVSSTSPLGCSVFPADNPINQDISQAPVDPNSASYVASIGASSHLHPDFGTDPSYGIPYAVVGASQPEVPISFSAYGKESDPGPYPIPANAPVEGAGQSGDRHVLVVQQGTCKLYELYNARFDGAGWQADSGAIFNFASNALRPDSWTSADAAGLPIFALLVRYEELQTGQIDHALRVTVPQTQKGFIHPATHYASQSTDPSLPPMGLRLRLKANFDESGYHGQALVVLQTLKRYGMIVADNGSSWYVTGAPDPRWNNEDLDQLKNVPGSAFEAVQTGPILRG